MYIQKNSLMSRNPWIIPAFHGLHLVLVLLLLHCLDVLRGLGLDIFDHLVITKLLLKRQPLLEEKARLLRANLLASLDGRAALLVIPDAEHPLEQAAHLLSVAVLDLQIQKDVPQVDALGERGQKALEHGASALDVAVLGPELDLRELGGRLHVGGGGQ